MRRAGARPLVWLTEAPWHAAELARQLGQAGSPVICAVGGDGTVHEVVNGLLELPEASRPALAVIPVGSGNDFVKMTGTPLDLERAARQAVHGTDRRIDAGRANGRFFGNGVGIGFDAYASRESRDIRYLTGAPLYLVAVLRALRSFPCPMMAIDIDGHVIRSSTLLCSVNNGRCVGGGFWIAPQADVQDGLLDVCHARGLGRLQILRLLPEVMRGTHVDNEPVTMARGRRVRVWSEIPLPVQADGELFPAPVSELDVEILPHSLTVRS